MVTVLWWRRQKQVFTSEEGDVIGDGVQGKDEPCSFREKRELALISEEALTGRFSKGKSEERKGAALNVPRLRTAVSDAVIRSEN